MVKTLESIVQFYSLGFAKIGSQTQKNNFQKSKQFKKQNIVE